MSVLRMSRIAHCGVRPSEQRLCTIFPSIEATRTLKRGSSFSPCSRFHSRPAEWNTSIGPIAVEG